MSGSQSDRQSTTTFSLDRQFEYENGFYQTAPVARISKFVTHLELFRLTFSLAGEIIECGVFKGNSLARWVKFRALLGNAWSKKIFAFDIFGEFPAATFKEDEGARQRFIDAAGSMSIQKDDLIATFDALGLNENLELIEGDICETVPAFVGRHPEIKISLLHIDVDLYEPTKACLDLLYPRVVRGGVVILDDYGAFPGANQAIDEFLSDCHLSVQKLPYSNAISYIQKP